MDKSGIMKQCKQCSKEFEPKNFRGSEQAYCSKECRTKAGNERYKLNLMTNGKYTTNGTQSMGGSLGTGSSERIGVEQIGSDDNSLWQSNGNFQKPSTGVTEIVRFIEQTYAAKTDANKFELKYEMALKEIEALKQEIVELELELEEHPEPKQGFIGGISDLLEGMPEWLTPAIGKLLQSEKVQKFVISQIPEPEPQNK